MENDLLSNTLGAFDWEIWIQILKSGFRICNKTPNPKTDFNAEKSVFGFPFYRSIGKSEKGFETDCPYEQWSCTRAHNQPKKTAVHENRFANPGFPIERNLIFGRQAPRKLPLFSQSLSKAF